MMKKHFSLPLVLTILGMSLQFTACNDARLKLAELAVANKATCRKTVEAMNTGDLSVLDSVMAPDFIEHTPDESVEGTGVPAMKESYKMMRTAFPDVHIEVINATAEGDRVMIHQTFTGTNTGLFGGMPPTGKAVKCDVVDIFAVKDGKITEHWMIYDGLGMMMQLGFDLVPASMARDSAEAPEMPIDSPN
jgi:steroid delta-isomerase-like uncharacterized protein